MKEKVKQLLGQFEDIEKQLGLPDAVSDQKKYRKLTQEHAYLLEIKEVWALLQKAECELVGSKGLAKEESDPDLIAMIQEEVVNLEAQIGNLQKQLEALLVPPDPHDNSNVILELRAGTGGDEAALFVGDCIRMYRLFADKMGWVCELLACTSSDAGGYKEYVMGVSGKNANRFLKYEAGTHRVQRVPATETQGRVHTSAITVAVLLEPTEEEKIEIDERDLKIDTYRASGAGGQHVNTTDSAVRITHMPTGVVVYCQEERSQHKNKDKALRVLSAKLSEEKIRKDQEERASMRSSQIGTGDRSERIRTYNFSQNRVTDHRINLTLYKLDKTMEGDLDEFARALVAHFYAIKLSEA
ncbi:MAG: peptide chain release factor 1 [Simkaniaceae bacterium]|nr:peptide chain release factor 1 [Simkaniaceae bacterium]